MNPEALMAAAIEAAGRGIEAGQSPFGCAIALDGKLLVATHNTVRTGPDITAHAEINALRAACGQSGRMFLEECEVATTCEPCPMCAAALHWARVRVVYYGASIADAKAAGFNELEFSATELLTAGASPVRLVSGIRTDACLELFARWQAAPDRLAY